MENKQETKKKKLSKKLMMILCISVLCVGGATAGLVGYLSNEAEVSVSVESPVLLEVSTDSTDGVNGNWLSSPATLSFGSIFGGEGITFWIKDTNLASVPIVGSSSKLVTNDDGVTCDDFESVTANGNDILTDYCEEVNSKTVKFDTYTAGGLDAGEVDVNEIVMAFKQNATGDYIFTMQKMA